MKKKLLLLVPALLISACGGGEPTPPDIEFKNQIEAVAPYKMKQSDSGKARIVNKNDVPMLVRSTLLRTDLLSSADFMKASETEDYFAIAKETGMNVMEINIMWSQVETSYNEYNFETIDSYLNFAKKYDLRLNLEWYGSFTDGQCVTGNLPKYVVDNKNDYPILLDLFDFANYGHAQIMDWTNEKLLKREQVALYALMNHIYDWNVQNDNYDPVIMVQIGQGIDRFQRWRIDQYKVPGKDGNLMNFEDAWNMVNGYVKEMARGVKYSKYKALTRLEFCEQSAVVNYVRNIKDIEFMDLVCPTYLHEISTMKNGIKNFVDEYEDMPIINAENWANDINYKQIMVEYAMGGSGYVSYVLSNPRYFPQVPNGSLYSRYNPEGATLKEKFVQINNRADDTKMINDAFGKAYVAAANAKRTNFALLGLNSSFDGKTGPDRIQKIYLNSGVLIDCSNPANSLGFAIFDDNSLYCYSNQNSSLDITNCNITIAQKGQFDAHGEWESKGVVSLEGNKTLTMNAGEVYRIKFASISPLPSVSVLTENGYKSTVDSIRS